MSLCCILGFYSFTGLVKPVFKFLGDAGSALVPVLIILCTGFFLYSDFWVDFMVSKGQYYWDFVPYENVTYPHGTIDKINRYIQLLAPPGNFISDPHINSDLMALYYFYEDRSLRTDDRAPAEDRCVYALIWQFALLHVQEELKKAAAIQLKLPSTEKVKLEVWNPNDRLYLLQLCSR